MTALPRVSVIVPFFNRQHYLAACIEALLAQDDVGGAVEILMVDNRSTDDSAAVVRRYPQVTLLREDTPGVYAARNAGIRIGASAAGGLHRRRLCHRPRLAAGCV